MIFIENQANFDNLIMERCPSGFCVAQDMKAKPERSAPRRANGGAAETFQGFKSGAQEKRTASKTKPNITIE